MPISESSGQRVAITGIIDEQAHRIRRRMRDFGEAQSTSGNHIVYEARPQRKLRFMRLNPFRRAQPNDRDDAAVWVVLGAWLVIFTVVIAVVVIVVHIRADSGGTHAVRSRISPTTHPVLRLSPQTGKRVLSTALGAKLPEHEDRSSKQRQREEV